MFQKHRPLKLFSPQNQSAIAIGFFRKPKDRLFSSFLDGWHHEGMNHSVWLDLKGYLKYSFFKLYPKALQSENKTAQHDLRVAMARKYMMHDYTIG
jgi:hypothetical protein